MARPAQTPKINAKAFLSSYNSSHSLTSPDPEASSGTNHAASLDHSQPIQIAQSQTYPSFASAALSLRTPNHLHSNQHFFSSSAPYGEQSYGSIVSEPSPASSSPRSPAAQFLSAFTPSVTSSKRSDPFDDGQSLDDYTLGRTIGVGGSSIIKHAHSPSGGIVAVKIVTHPNVLDQTHQRNLRREARIWTSLNHEHILPLFDSSLNREGSNGRFFSYFVTLYCPAGSLFDILHRSSAPMPQDDAGMMFRQIVRGLRYLHEERRLVHGDIKLENVLVDESGVCRISDFGMTRQIDDSDESSDEEGGGGEEGPQDREEHDGNMQRGGRASKPFHLSLRRHHHLNRPRNMSSPVPSHNEGSDVPRSLPRSKDQQYDFPQGSLPYASPELLQLSSTPFHHSKRTRPSKHPAQDIWALGVLLYALLDGHLPFMDSFEPRLVGKVLRGSYIMPQGIGAAAEDVLRGCLCMSVEERWDIVEVDDKAWGVGWGDRTVSRSTPPVVVGTRTPRSPDPRPISNRSSRKSSRPRITPQSYVQRDESPEHELSPNSAGDYHSPPSSRPNRRRDASQSSRQRSTSRPPFAGSPSERNFSGEPLEPLVTRISVSIERGRRKSPETDSSARGTSSRSSSRSSPPVTPPDDGLDEDGLLRGRKGKIHTKSSSINTPPWGASSL
ncbi:kinase-like protein [Sistotremastrum niveocremeum HHB9708]|uniref:Kinase-like protein n=1 Tax=Sistotremastrum niveocremeum HHB9708 TaxID=1314777 RepID=A0A165AE52_9AGAM|nr:kinase-like protein [Sistotremastrum niveocremeum HHB9708]